MSAPIFPRERRAPGGAASVCEQPPVSGSPRGGRARDRAAERAGVSARTVQDAGTVKESDPALFAAIKRGELSAEKAAQVVRRRRTLAALPPSPALPAGPFELLYADPPWSFGTPDSAYAPENHYPTMALEELKAIEIPAADDSLIFLCGAGLSVPSPSTGVPLKFVGSRLNADRSMSTIDTVSPP